MDIVYSKRAKKFLDKQNEETRNRIITAVEKLPAGDVKRLRGLDGFRLRVGTYRIIFDQEGIVINIIDIDNRGQAYK